MVMKKTYELYDKTKIEHAVSGLGNVKYEPQSLLEGRILCD